MQNVNTACKIKKNNFEKNSIKKNKKIKYGTHYNVYKKICIDTAKKGKYNSCFNFKLKSEKLSYSPL